MTALLDHLPEIAATVSPDRRAFSVSVPQHLEPHLRERYRVMDGGDWEWFHTTTAPDEHPSHERVVVIDDVARADEVRAFLEAHSPTADTEPGHGERWFAVEDVDGSLCAVAAWGATRAGAPHLSSVAVDTRLRGQGLGRTIVGAVTRLAVAETGRLHPRDVLPQRRRPRALPVARLRPAVRLVEPPGRHRPLTGRRTALRRQAKSAAVTVRSAGSTSTTQLPELSRQTASVP